MRLSKREKVLIIVLLVFGSLALFIAYVLVPKMKEATALKMQVSDAQMQLAQVQMEYESGQDVKGQVEQAQAEADMLYGSLQGNREYDTSLLLSDMLVSCGLTPMQFSIGERVPLTVTVESEAEAVETSSSFTYSREITLVFSGTRASANKFIDKIATFDKCFVLHGISMQGGESESYSLQITLYEFEK